MDSITHGRCGGGWYDALDCTPEKFVEQAYYTILGGMKESLVHCYDYLLSDDSGRTPFGEKAANPRACAKAFERECGKEFVVYLNTIGEGVIVPGTNLTVAPHVVRVYPLP